MRVLHVIESLGSGGTERSLAELLEPLTERGVNSKVVCFGCGEGSYHDVIGRGIQVDVLSERSWSSRILSLRQNLQAWRPDLVHTSLFRSDLVGRLATVGTGIPVLGSLVSTPYADVRFKDPGLSPLRLSLARAVDGMTARWMCDHFCAVSQSAKDAALRDLRIPSDRVTVINRGRDPKRLGEPGYERRQYVRKRLDLSEQAIVLVNVGRHVYQKAQLGIVEAVSLLVENWPDIKLLVVGRQGPTTESLDRSIAELGLEQNVSLLGYRDDVPDILAAADLFVFPSLYEGLPGALIEAMALGLPVIASNIRPVREVAIPNETCELVEEMSPQMLAAAIDRMLKQRGRMLSLGRRGREVFLERFSLDVSVRRTVELYRRLVH